MTIVKIIWVGLLSAVALQDSIERKVYLFFFPLLLVGGMLLQLSQWDWGSVLLFGLINSTVTILALLLLWGYARWQKLRFLDHSMGSGDVLMLIVLAWSFPPLTFLCIWLFTSLFSLIVFAFWLKVKKIPLAGHLALFVALLSVGDSFCASSVLYSYTLL